MDKLGQFVYSRIKTLRDRANVDKYGNILLNHSLFQEITEQILKATMDEYPKEVGGCTYKGSCAFQNVVNALKDTSHEEAKP